MGLFTEDLEKNDSNSRGQSTIVEGPVSPQTPTSPVNDTAVVVGETVAPAAAAAENPQGSDQATKRTVSAADDDDDDLFKEN